MQHQRRHRHRRVPTPVLDRLRCNGLRHAARTLRPQGQALDVKSAFRLSPVRPSEHHLLGMQWRGHFYFNRILPFGLHSAPFIFNALTDTVEWLAYVGGGGGGSPTCTTTWTTSSWLGLCSMLGIPLAEDKLAGPTTELEYLGILLDSRPASPQTSSRTSSPPSTSGLTALMSETSCPSSGPSALLLRSSPASSQPLP